MVPQLLQPRIGYPGRRKCHRSQLHLAAPSAESCPQPATQLHLAPQAAAQHVQARLATARHCVAAAQLPQRARCSHGGSGCDGCDAVACGRLSGGCHRHKGCDLGEAGRSGLCGATCWLLQPPAPSAASLAQAKLLPGELIPAGCATASSAVPQLAARRAVPSLCASALFQLSQRPRFTQRMKASWFAVVVWACARSYQGQGELNNYILDLTATTCPNCLPCIHQACCHQLSTLCCCCCAAAARPHADP